MANTKSVHDLLASHRVDTWHFQAFSVISSAFEGATVIEKMEKKNLLYLPDLVVEPQPHGQESEEQKPQSHPGSDPEAERGNFNHYMPARWEIKKNNKKNSKTEHITNSFSF